MRSLGQVTDELGGKLVDVLRVRKLGTSNTYLEIN